LSNKPTLAFLGIGIMGKGIVQNLIKKNISLKIYNRSFEKIKALKSENTEIFTNPEDAVKDADYTILCLTEDEIVESVFFKILPNLKGTLLDFGTTSLDLTEKIHVNCKEKSINFLDSPMTGSKLAAENGQILFMVGADSDEIYQSCKFIWSATGKNSLHCGKVSYGQRAKIALNMIQANVLQSYLEGIILSEKIGIDNSLMLEIISQSAAKSGISDFKLNCIANNDYSTNFSLKNMNKDLNHAVRISIKENLSLPLTYSNKGIYNLGMLKNLGEEDFCTLYKVNKEINSAMNNKTNNNS
jgi:3-hydroxyisobutyrate dehydrogenase